MSDLIARISIRLRYPISKLPNHSNVVSLTRAVARFDLFDAIYS